jgi:CheY-specific phosphatase CheX
MSAWNSTTIDEVFLDIVEKLAFMFGDPCDVADMSMSEGSWSRASIRFKGSVTGVVSLSVPDELCLEIAENILGMDMGDVEDELEVGRDSVKEMLNVVCGHVVPILQGDGSDVQLEVPVLESVRSEECIASASQDGVTAYNLDGSPVLLGFHLDGE